VLKPNQSYFVQVEEDGDNLLAFTVWEGNKISDMTIIDSRSYGCIADGFFWARGVVADFYAEEYA
jgi:hypothetical protein